MITLAELQYLISTLRLAKGLVIAGLGDIQRPAEKLSVSQSSALAATGVVWSRYSLVIIPKNWSLFSVNVFVAITNFYQLTRAVRYQRSLKIKEENKL
ncbi:mitochondrial pyruvate carrier 2-like isoform X1 [Lycorma delicatula]|uniref:mitochondrial pyruvate carrier 2-like n=1 Tax=Lycorma delicatula TaxID=130591 RepID=UPI003F50DB17